MVMRVKRPLVPGIIPPCLITCVYSCRDGARPVSHCLIVALSYHLEGMRRGVPRLYNRVITVLAPFRLLPK